MQIKSQIPNLLSLFRIFSIFPFFYFINHGNFYCALILIILAGLSDFFDGYIARKLKVESKIGALLDPLADKLFSNSVLWGLWVITTPDSRYYYLYLILAIVLTCRDSILVLGSLFVVFKRWAINLKPLYISKVCTTMIFTFVSFSIVFIKSSSIYDHIHFLLKSMNLTFVYSPNSMHQFFTSYIGLPLGYLCITLIFITFVIYLYRFLTNILREYKKQ